MGLAFCCRVIFFLLLVSRTRRARLCAACHLIRHVTPNTRQMFFLMEVSSTSERGGSLRCRAWRLLIDSRVERAPGAVQQLVYPAPVILGDAAFVGPGVAYLHRLGAEARVLCEAFGGEAEDFGLEVCEGAVEVAGRVASPLAVDDPLLELHEGGARRRDA